MVGSVKLSSATAPLLAGPWLSCWLRRHGALCAWRPPSWCRGHVDGDDGESFRSFWLAFFRANCKAKLPGVESWTKYDPLPDWWWSAELVLYERMPFLRCGELWTVGPLFSLFTMRRIIAGDVVRVYSRRSDLLINSSIWGIVLDIRTPFFKACGDLS
jgi:hypothetical protein